MLETALTPRLCPRVFSREFLDARNRSGGVIVGASLGSIRVVRHAVTGWRHVEYLLMVSVGDRCRRSWRSHSDFAAHARRRYRGWAPPARAAWTVAEVERRWLPCVDDYPYVAASRNLPSRGDAAAGGSSRTGRDAAAGLTWIFRGRVATPPRA